MNYEARLKQLMMRRPRLTLAVAESLTAGHMQARIAAGSGAFNSDTSAISAKAQATAILGYAYEVKLGVDRVLGHGCKDTDISFENPVVGGYINPNSPSDN